MSEQPAEIMTEATITGTAEITPDPTPEVEATAETSGEPETFSREYVSRLRAENAEARVRAKIADHANELLLAAYAGQDGRLVDNDVLAVSADLLGDDGLVDRDRVAERIGSLIAEKPYLQARKAASVPMGVRSDPPAEVGWVDVLRGTR